MTDGAKDEIAGDPPQGGEAPLKNQVLDQLGGWQGMVYSTLPVLAFVPVDTVFGLGWAAAAAVGVAVVIFVIRLATRTSLQPAISGLVGVAICVAIALLLGGRWYFAYGIIVQLPLALAFLVSIVIRRPLAGVMWHLFSEGNGGAADWRSDPRQLRAFSWLSLGWVLVFLTRFVVQGALFLWDSVTWLGAARIAMGWPMFAAALLVTFVVARKVTGPVGTLAAQPNP